MNWMPNRGGSPPMRGLWLTLGSPTAAELASQCGFDWVLLDLEHGLGDGSALLHELTALSTGKAAAIVRVPDADSPFVARALDWGAAGIMLPRVESAAAAEAFARRLRYPPQGSRGLTRSSRAAAYGTSFETYRKEAAAQTVAVAQIETREGVACADAIASVPGIDVLFMGHSDLAMDLGCGENPEAPEILSAEKSVLDACARHGKKTGMLVKSGQSAAACIRKGFAFIALGSDLGCLKAGYRQLLDG